jgi:hypothetical protein
MSMFLRQYYVNCIIKYEIQKYYPLVFILFTLSFLLLTCLVCLTNTTVELGKQSYLHVVVGC